VRLGIEHGTSNSQRTSEEDSSNGNDGNSPCWENSLDCKEGLLSSVGEVVVSGGHVVECRGVIHSDEASIKVSWGSVQLSAVSFILFSIACIISIGSQKLFSGHADRRILSNVSESLSERCSVEQWSVGIEPILGSWLGLGEVFNLNDVGSISSVSSFSSVSVGVGVTSGPLEVNVVIDQDSKIFWNEVILSGWVGLDDVSSLSSDVDVVDSLVRSNSGRSWSNGKDVGSVLECSSELSGINSELECLVFLLESWVIEDWGGLSIGSIVSEVTIRRIGGISS